MKLNCPNSVRLGVLLRSIRRSEHKTIRTVATEMGISHSTLSRIERGYPPSYEVWRHLEAWMAKRNIHPC